VRLHFDVKVMEDEEALVGSRYDIELNTGYLRQSCGGQQGRDGVLRERWQHRVGAKTTMAHNLGSHSEKRQETDMPENPDQLKPYCAARRDFRCAACVNGAKPCRCAACTKKDTPALRGVGSEDTAK
jgi:hypothetical protein